MERQEDQRAEREGDNYQLRASFTNFNPATAGYDPNYHLKGESGIVTAWKRAYVERDRMFSRGALLEDDFIPAACGNPGDLACRQLVVFDWTNVAVNDQVILFQTEDGLGQIQTAPMLITAIVPGPRFSRARPA